MIIVKHAPINKTTMQCIKRKINTHINYLKQ